MPLITRCVCSSTTFSQMERNGLQMAYCQCGIWHQEVEMDEAGLATWYAERYHAGIYGHSYDHDLEVARKRIEAYGDWLQGPVLDVGCGNGAFVDACQDAGVNAIGQDLGGSAADLKVPLDQVSGTFQTITMHDVLEHAPDPIAMLCQARSLLIDGGRLIVDFPGFFHAKGAHHWKPVEHLWMLDVPHLVTVIQRGGFTVKRLTTPVPAKYVVYAE